MVDHQLAEQRFLVLEVPVEEALGHAGVADDVEHPRVGVAALGEELGRAVEQLLLALETLGGEPARLARVVAPSRAIDGRLRHASQPTMHLTAGSIGRDAA